FGETLWGSNVKKLDIGIPDAKLDVTKITLSHDLLAGIFVAAVAASLALMFAWRARAVRSAIDTSKGLVQPPLIGPGTMGFGLFGLVCFLARFFVGPEAAFINGKASATQAFFANLSWFGIGAVALVVFLAAATRLGRRQAAEDHGADVAPLHYVWFVLL